MSAQNKKKKRLRELKRIAKETAATIKENRKMVEEIIFERLSQEVFLNENEMRIIASTIAQIPSNYVRDSEAIKDWWNYCQYPANFGGILHPFNITICIGKIRSILQDGNYITHQIASERFSEIKEVNVHMMNKKHVYYQIEDLSDVELKDEPIIIFKDSIESHRVIDGNHRTTNAVKNNLPFLDAYIVDEVFITEHECFGTKYDQELYYANKLVYDAYFRHMS